MSFLWFQTTPKCVAHCRQSTYHCCRFVCFRRNDNWNLHNITKMGLCYWFLLSDGHFLWFVVRVTFHMNLLLSLFHIGISFSSASCRLQAQRLVIVCHFCGVFILSKARERESVCVVSGRQLEAYRTNRIKRFFMAQNMLLFAIYIRSTYLFFVLLALLVGTKKNWREMCQFSNCNKSLHCCHVNKWIWNWKWNEMRRFALFSQ